MKVDLGIWSKLTWAVIVLGFIAGLGLVANFYLPLIRQNERMRRDIAELNLQIQKEEDIARNLKASMEGLRRDPKTVERLAREKLWYAKPDETVIRFIEPATNNDQTPR
jgi:cell division protein FtsB